MSKTQREKLIQRLVNSLKKKPYEKICLTKIETAEMLQTIYRLQAKEAGDEDSESVV